MSVADELHRLGDYRIRTCLRVAEEDPTDGIAASTLLAIGSVETNMRNIVGGGHFDASGKFVVTGVDRGFFQVNDHYHAAFLQSVPGCRSGEWHVAPGHSAHEKGYVPQFTTACRYVAGLRGNSVEYAIDSGVHRGDRIRFSIAAHNAGNGGALRGYREGDIDKYTTGGDYSARVLDRRDDVQRWLRAKKYV